LEPLQGDTVSFALSTNDNGQASGVSGVCGNTTVPPINNPSGPHAVVWDRGGKPKNVPSLPGNIGDNVAGSINNNGIVVGTQGISDGTVHGFVWNQVDAPQDLVYPGAFVTVLPCCRSVNNKGDAVGFAIDDNGPVAFSWKDGNFTDLNTVIPADSPWYLLNAFSINDPGQIVGAGVKLDTGEVHAFLLTPISPVGAPVAKGATKRPDLPQSVKDSLPKSHRQ
jgi:probable HAF family extracellular repeat protein